MTGERDFELAEEMAERQRQAGIARARAALRCVDPDEPEGPLVCDCGDPIGEERRRAVPNTRKCINCATFLERPRRRA
jgi:RNA polymerase-binding transcription factor DksA